MMCYVQHRVSYILLIWAFFVPGSAWCQGTRGAEIQSVAIGATQQNLTSAHGLTPEEWQELIEAAKVALAGSGGPPPDLKAISQKLGITEKAALFLVRTLGEQNLTPDRFDEIIGRYKQVVESLARLKAEDPTSRGLVNQVHAATRAKG